VLGHRGPPHRGRTSSLGSDSGLVPTRFEAVTVNVYGSPGVRPVTTTSVCSPPTRIGSSAVPSRYGVTTYSTIGAPPLNVGGFHVTVADPSPASAVTSRAASGARGTAYTSNSDNPLFGPVPPSTWNRTQSKVFRSKVTVFGPPAGGMPVTSTVEPS